MARKKRRVAPAEDEEAARRKFLEALEAQRANARLRSVEKPVDTQAAAAPAAVLPGFYYDEAKKRYFRSSPESERRQREQLELQQQEIQLAEQKSPVKVKIRRGYGFGVNGHNWVDYLAQRQSDFSWSARGRDRRELTPQLLSGLLSSQVVESQDVHNEGRLTALALHPRASNLGAMGASSGRLDILGLRRMQPEPGTASPSQSVLPIVSFDIDGVITELEWRPVRELDLLVCSLGSGRRNTQRASGGVSYMRVGDQSSGGRAVMSVSRMKSWTFVDPWTAKWDPTNGSNFSVGCGGSSTAAYVDGVRQLGSILRAPTGTITSDVHAQSFYSTGQVVLNGTKDGGLWGWDLRCPSRIYEWAADVVAGQPAGSVLDVHVLNDSRRAVVHRSNGELRLLDLRNCKPVVEFVSGLPKRYLQNLRCAVDTHETVVVAGGDTQHPQAVNSYELQHGRCVASLEVKPTRSSSVHEKRSTLVQQVQLKSGLYDSRYADTPEIWALSRNELYICSGRTNDPTE
ncbi:WD40/YVTN repeat-like-containing domain [Phytophthora cinnamomi]|uniref:WD40/YVTN repeat-like-containing domain n=1 Tax=Phytophthora cinnamomi TaxID=4785 RepID=UPI003559A366|nr:WD40/YVTN repeat-like-containing domain [Phytophthora cinnamomi]